MEKSWEFSGRFCQDQNQDQDLFVNTKTKTSGIKTKTFLFVLDVPRVQDFGLEDYITDTTDLFTKPLPCSFLLYWKQLEVMLCYYKSVWKCYISLCSVLCDLRLKISSLHFSANFQLFVQYLYFVFIFVTEKSQISDSSTLF